jgi:hypothetical protein
MGCIFESVSPRALFRFPWASPQMPTVPPVSLHAGALALCGDGSDYCGSVCAIISAKFVSSRRRLCECLYSYSSPTIFWVGLFIYSSYSSCQYQYSSFGGVHRQSRSSLLSRSTRARPKSAIPFPQTPQLIAMDVSRLPPTHTPCPAPSDGSRPRRRTPATSFFTRL